MPRSQSKRPMRVPSMPRTARPPIATQRINDKPRPTQICGRFVWVLWAAPPSPVYQQYSELLNFPMKHRRGLLPRTHVRVCVASGVVFLLRGALKTSTHCGFPLVSSKTLAKHQPNAESQGPCAAWMQNPNPAAPAGIHKGLQRGQAVALGPSERKTVRCVPIEGQQHTTHSDVRNATNRALCPFSPRGSLSRIPQHTI